MNKGHHGVSSWAGLLAAVALLAACGGGGGDAAVPPVLGPADAPLALTPQNAADAAALAAGAGELVLQLGQVAVDGSSRFLAAGAAPSDTQTCANGGSIVTTLADRDNDGIASAGDRVTIDFRDCGVLLMGAVLSGTAAIEIAAAGVAPATLRGEVTLGNGVVFTPSSGPVPGVTLTLVGSWAFRWTDAAFRSVLAVSSTPADDLRLVGAGSGVTVTESFLALSVSKALHRDEARSIVNMSFRHESGSLGGSLVVTTPQPLLSYPNTHPDVGRLEARGANGAVVRVRPSLSVISHEFVAELDVDGDGRAEATVSAPWTDSVQGYLWWDGRSQLTWGDLPYLTLPFSATGFSYSTPGFDPSRLSGEYYVQFSRPPAAGTALQFRFRDGGSTREFDGVRIDIAADVSHQGALYIVRPRQSLRHARNYEFEASADSVNWSGSVVRDTLGHSLSIGRLGSITTPDTMRTVITASGVTLLSAGAAVDLNALASTSSRPIASYRWTQLSGTPLALSAPQSPATQVRWGPVAPPALEHCVIELTITDTAGETETSQISIAAYQPGTVTRLLYFRSSPGDYIGGGQTVTVSETTGTFAPLPANTGGIVNFSYSEPGSASWSLSLAGPNGAPLAVGSYNDAARAVFAGDKNGLEFSGSGRGCNLIFGRFTVLELQTDPQGVVTKMAVDFEQHCENAQAPPLFGSLRVNSTLPVSP